MAGTAETTANSPRPSRSGATSSSEELRVAVAESLALMEAMLANPKPLTPQVLDAWVLVLRHAGLTADEVRAGTGKALTQLEFFPSPAVFLKVIRPPADEDAVAELAWQQVLTCIERHGVNASLCAADFGGDGAALWAVSRVGWEDLCLGDPEKRAIRRASFVRCYQLARGNGTALHYLAGPMERANDLKGRDLNPALCGRPDWRCLPARSPLPALPEGEPAALAAVLEGVAGCR